MSEYLKRDQERLSGAAHPFHRFPKYLHHAEKPPIVAHDAETEKDAREKGYADEYQHQEYPKHVEHPGTGELCLVHSAEEEHKLGKPGKPADEDEKES